jgi:TIR domain-containing protein
MTGKIFINYRRGDDPQAAGRLFDRLQDIFEPQQLFLDVDNIAPGLDFMRVLDERVAECDVVLAVIGKGWIDARDAAGARRLDDPDDFVRIEITSALNQGKRVIPVLIGDTPMPHQEQLPEALRPLARRNAVRLTHERFRADTQGLVKALEQALAEIEEARQQQAQAEAERQAAEQRRLQEAEAARRGEEEALRRKAEQDAKERAAEERRRLQEAEAARRAEEEALKRKAEQEAKERAEAERRRLQTEAKQRVEAERAFAAAKHTNTIAAINAFLAAYPASALAEEAKSLEAALLVRQQAYRNALASDDAAVLRSFIRVYRKGADADGVRARLRLIQARPIWSLRKPAIVIPGALVIAFAAAFVVWLEVKPGPADRQTPLETSEPAPPVVPEAPNVQALPAPVDSAPSTPQPANSGVAETPREIVEPQAPDPDQVAWNLIKDSKNPDQLRRFIDRFPESAHRGEAEQRIVLLSSVPPPSAATNAPDPHELARSLQFELQRVGCFKGDVNGEFNDETKAAWSQFVKLTSVSIPNAVTTDAINAVRSINKRVCPLTCRGGEHAEGDLCVANPPPKPPPRKAAESVAPAAPAPRIILPPGGGGGGGGCRNPRWHRLPGGGCGY